MKRREAVTDDETESESVDEEITESDESLPPSTKTGQFLGIPSFSLSYKQLPKKFLKISFLCINGATFLSGITALVISIWMLADSKLMSRLVGQRLFVTILLFVGLLTSMVAFLGIIAIVKKRKKFLIIYILCHVASLCIIFICAIMSFSFFDKIMRKIREDMLNTIVNYHSLDWVTEAWDNTHQYLRCCGIRSYKDWAIYHMNIPQSCCSSTIEQCLIMNKDLAYKSGCLKRALILLKSNVHAVAVSALFIAMILAAGIFLAVGVCKRYRWNRPPTGSNMKS